MIDIADFYAELGAAQTPGADEQLVLPGDVRVQAEGAGWSAIFESVPATEPYLRAALELGRQVPGVLPFLTRSGQVAMRWPSPSPMPDTTQAVRALRAVMRHMAAV